MSVVIHFIVFPAVKKIKFDKVLTKFQGYSIFGHSVSGMLEGVYNAKRNLYCIDITVF